MRPLDPVLAADLTPGSNLKGDIPGASWRFLLDRVTFERVLFVGSPSRATLRGLARASPPSGAGPADEGDVPFVVARWNGDDALDLEDASVDLVVVLGGRRVVDLARHPRRCAELVRVATPTAPVVLDGHGLGVPGLVRRLAGRLDRARAELFFVTPHVGEVETAIPAGTPAVLDWFRERGHLRPSVDKRDLAGLSERIGARPGGRSRVTPGDRDAAQGSPNVGPTFAAGGAGGRRRRVRGIVAAALGGAAALERAVDRAVPAVQRAVVVLEPGAPRPAVPVPAYIAAMADGAGANVSGSAWGVAAGAEYASQKVLLPLFDPGATNPTYLVKLTRDARYSPRLDRATDALERLAQLGLADGTATPRVAFRGAAGGLAVVAETAIRGRPFREAMAGRDDPSNHSLGAAVVGWLTDLGVRSRVDDRVAGIRAPLAALLDRYIELYRPDVGQERFLRRTILAPASERPIPLVMQHGDPGPQNLVVTDDDVIGVLDWENADPLGLPMADVTYFLWTYAVMEGLGRGHRDPVDAGLPHLLDGSPLTPFFARSVETYRAELDLDGAMLAPLFYASWLYQALKEATRLPESRLHEGVYARVLAACGSCPDAPGLRAFFPPIT